MTYEAARAPAHGDAFAWRVSVAHIDISGPFSDFAGYHRKMVLLEGNGLELEFADGGVRRLARVGDLAEFDGAPAPGCTLLGGPCVDLNLMVAKAHSAEIGIEWLAGQETISADATSNETTLIFSINDALALTIDAQIFSLEPGDLAVITSGSADVTPLESRAAANASAVFFATISH